MRFCFIACGLLTLPAAADAARPEQPRAALVVRLDPCAGRLGVPPHPETGRYIHKFSRKLGEAKRSPAADGTPPAAPAPPVVEQYTDAAGALQLRTRPSP